MKASISYLELQRLVTEQTHQPISFEYVDNKTIKILYEINLGILRKKVGVNLRVLEIIGSDLRLRYSTELGVDSMVSMALKMVKDKIPAGLLEEQPDHVLLVHLGMLDKVRPVFERINVKEVSMLSDNLEIAGDFK